MSTGASDGNKGEGVKQMSILGRYVKPEDFKHLMDFYKADHKLNQTEREFLSKDISSARNTSTLWGMFDCTIALLTPTLYKKYTERKSGVNVPKGPKKATFHRPILSTIFATGVYFCSVYYHSKNNQEYRIARLTVESNDPQLSEAERESKQRLLGVWKALHPAQLTLFSFYYKETVLNPGLIMKNPMDVASTDPHAVQYFPPPDHSRGGTLAAVQEHERSAPHWEKLREANGFGPPNASSPEEQESARGEEKENLVGLESSNSETQGSSSAWDNLRKSR